MMALTYAEDDGDVSRRFSCPLSLRERAGVRGEVRGPVVEQSVSHFPLTPTLSRRERGQEKRALGSPVPVTGNWQ
jgi:hypothetical protein